MRSDWKQIVARLTGKCAECELGEYCGGGCRSYNYFVHGKLFESPFCAGGAKVSE